MGLSDALRRLGASDLAGEIDAQIRVLEAMFADPGLERLRRAHRTHPAVRRLDWLREIQHGGYQPAEELPAVQTLSSMLIDRSTWASTPLLDVPYWSMLEDEASRRFVEQRLVDPTSFGDVLSELFFWGWLRSQGVTARMTEREGFPDLSLRVSEVPTPVWADVKRIHRGTQVSRIAKVINKANKQIKTAAGEGASGIVFVYLEREGLRASFDDRIPSDIQPYVNQARSVLQKAWNRSVGAVVVAWDDYMVISDDGRRAFYAIRRRSISLDHVSPRQRLDIRRMLPDLGMTVTMTARVDGRRPASLPSIAAEEAVVTSQFRELNEFVDGMRVGHALEVISDPDDWIELRLTGTGFIVATRFVGHGSVPHTALVMATRRPGEKPEIMSGFKLYGSVQDLAKAAHDAASAFRRILLQFGEPIRVGGQTGLFVPRAVVPLTGDGANLVEGLSAAPPKSLIVQAICRRRATDVEVEFAYAINRAAYDEAVRRKRPRAA